MHELKHHEVNSLDNFIMGFYIDNDDLCDRIINEHNNNPDKQPGKIGPAIIDESWKKSVDTSMPLTYYEEYMSYLDLCINQYTKKYSRVMDTPTLIHGGHFTINIQEYPPGGGFYKWHSERLRLPTANRFLVFMTYLNDIKDGGETEFLYQNVKIKPEKGLTIIWPSDWTHTHRGVTAPNETKYILTSWLLMGE